MAEGLTFDLLKAALFVGLIGFIIASRNLPYPSALLIAFLKAAIPLVYFAWFYDGIWTFLDDVTYQLQGEEMLHLGYTPLTALTDPEGIEQLMKMSEGRHILYGWWNLLGQYFFGEHYYSPVFLNVALTFISGFFFVRILRELGFHKQYLSIFLIFFLLQWDIVAWSSLVNLKDIPVMTLTVMSFFLLVKLFQKIQLIPVISFLLVMYIFSYIRFFSAFLILSAVGAWMIIEWRKPKKYLLLPFIFWALYTILQRWSFQLYLIQPAGVLYGIIHFLTTPQPWSIDEAYSFLLLPSIFHWILLVPSVISFYYLWKRSRLTRLLLTYFLVVITFYAMTPELRGPRQRVQIIFVIVWLQFHFFWILSHSTVPSLRHSKASDIASSKKAA